MVELIKDGMNDADKSTRRPKSLVRGVTEIPEGMVISGATWVATAVSVKQKAPQREREKRTCSLSGCQHIPSKPTATACRSRRSTSVVHTLFADSAVPHRAHLACCRSFAALADTRW